MPRLYYLYTLVLYCTSLQLSSATTWETTVAQVLQGEPADHSLGSDVAVDGNVAIIGDPSDDEAGNSAGAAYIYRRQASGYWKFEAKLIGSDIDALDDFGSAVDIVGNQALIGAPYHGIPFNTCGAAYLFERMGDTWIQTKKIQPSDIAAWDHFGFSVAIDPDSTNLRIAIGAPTAAKNNIPNVGAAYAFEKLGNIWSEQKLQPAFAAENDGVGQTVDISDGTILTGAAGFNDIVMGKLYHYREDGGQWFFQSTLAPLGIGIEDQFAQSLSLDGDYAIVGAPGDSTEIDDGGAAYLYKKIVNTWVLIEKIAPQDPLEGARFGQSVSLHEKNLAIGIPNKDGDAEDAGQVLCYTIENNSAELTHSWQPTSASTEYRGRFGESVAVSGSTLIAGAPDAWHDGVDRVFSLDLVDIHTYYLLAPITHVDSSLSTIHQQFLHRPLYLLYQFTPSVFVEKKIWHNHYIEQPLASCFGKIISLNASSYPPQTFSHFSFALDQSGSKNRYDYLVSFNPHLEKTAVEVDIFPWTGQAGPDHIIERITFFNLCEGQADDALEPWMPPALENQPEANLEFGGTLRFENPENPADNQSIKFGKPVFIWKNP